MMRVRVLEYERNAWCASLADFSSRRRGLPGVDARNFSSAWLHGGTRGVYYNERDPNGAPPEERPLDTQWLDSVIHSGEAL